MQETHIGDEIIGNFKKSKYVWYYSGGGLEAKGKMQQRSRHHHQEGVIELRPGRRNNFRMPDDDHTPWQDPSNSGLGLRTYGRRHRRR